jgi:hypothetical protein
MPELLITCPSTGELFSTGMSMEKQAFERSNLVNALAGPCPHCGQMHPWRKEDVRFEDEQLR